MTDTVKQILDRLYPDYSCGQRLHHLGGAVTGLLNGPAA